MAGIYIHIPFCKQACIYCDFHFSTNLKNKEVLIQCIKKEIILRKGELENEKIETIYFGGGTPSLCSADELGEILDVINTNFSISNDAEISLEANPDDLSREYLFAIRNTGINRLSIGIQSFFEEDLLWMNRAHHAIQAKECITNALDMGFSNISADLIFATPLLSQQKLEENLNILTNFGIPHLSCYNLTIEERTNLHHQVIKKKINTVADETAIEKFYFIRKFLIERGYEHYEISNYAKPGKQSRHNTSYWKGKKYLGIGPSAHSYNGVTRSWNIRNNKQYIQKISINQPANEQEVLSKENMFNEVLLTGLRTQWGVDLQLLESKFSEQFVTIKPLINQMVKDKKIAINEAQMTILPDCLVMADSIASDLFII